MSSIRIECPGKVTLLTVEQEILVNCFKHDFICSKHNIGFVTLSTVVVSLLPLFLRGFKILVQTVFTSLSMAKRTFYDVPFNIEADRAVEVIISNGHSKRSIEINLLRSKIHNLLFFNHNN